MNENIQKFLIDLTELSNKHGIYISGCGCCGSPFLTECNDYNGETLGGEILGENLKIVKGFYLLEDKE